VARYRLQQRAESRFFAQHRNLARKYAHQYSHQCLEPYEDLEQIASLGLLKAIRKFDPQRGTAFSSFAVPYITGEIGHHLRDRWDAIKTPRRLIEFYQRVERDQKRLAALGVERSLAEIAAILKSAPGAPKDDWEFIVLAVKKRVVSLTELAESGREP
jgi:RNA polymerase sigma-B factor